MDKKKIYVSLPITGRKKEDYEEYCKAIQKYLEYYGYETVSFLQSGLPTEAPYGDHMRADYKLLLSCDAIFLCDGWEYSVGCRHELLVATDCRMAVLTEQMDIDDVDARLQDVNK